MTLEYYVKTVYGNDLIYFADLRSANLWHAMTGKKTITTSEMEQLTRLTGVQFTRVFEPVSV